MIRKLLVLAVVLVPAVIAVPSASAQPSPTPLRADCAEIRATLQFAGDGDYLLDTGTHLVPVYCHDMARTPREYVTLGAANFSQYTAGGAAPGTSTRTTFTRVRIDPDTLVVDINDLTFATSTGSVVQNGWMVISSLPYGVAASCDARASGVGRVDLNGTAFVLSGGFAVGGYLPSGSSATVSADNRGADLVGGGYCGAVTPAPHIYSPVNPSGPDFHLALACAPYSLLDLVRGKACADLT